MTDQYNGWTNRETWTLASMLLNTESLYLKHRGSSASDLQSDIEYLRDAVAQGNGSSEDGAFICSIGSLWRVNWDEIAKALSEGEAK